MLQKNRLVNKFPWAIWGLQLLRKNHLHLSNRKTTTSQWLQPTVWAVGSQGIFTLKHQKKLLQTSSLYFTVGKLTQGAVSSFRFFSCGAFRILGTSVRQLGKRPWWWHDLMGCLAGSVLENQSKAIVWRISSCIYRFIAALPVKLNPRPLVRFVFFGMVLWWPQMAGKNWAHRFPEYLEFLP